MSVGTLFDGTDDRIESGTGTNFSSLAGHTCLYICHPDTLTSFDTAFSMINDGGASGLTFGWSGTSPYLEQDTSQNRVAVAQLYAGWYEVIWTKPAGTGQHRVHIFNGQSWAHANVGATQANAVATVLSLELGRYDAGASDPFDGDIAIVGIWSEDTNDANCEALLDYDAILAKSNRQFLTGTSLLNGGTMADSGAGNNETARTGATTGVRHLPGWFLDFDTDGFANASQWRAGGVATGTLVLTPPLGTVSGDLLIAAGTVDTASTLSNSTGWTEIRNTANASAIRHVVWGRIADGGANDTLTMTQGTAGSDISGVMVRVTDHGVTTVATDVYSGTPATNTSINPNPPSLTPSPGSDDYLWIVTFGADDDDDQANWVPNDFSGIRQVESASSTTSTLTGMAFRKFTGTVLDPGTFNMAASEEWVANTLAIPPAAGDTVVSASTLTTTLSMQTARGVVASTPSPISTGTTFGAPTGVVRGTGSLNTTVSVQGPANAAVGFASALTTTLAMQTAIGSVRPTPAVIATTVNFNAPTNLVVELTTTLSTTLAMQTAIGSVRVTPAVVSTTVSFGAPLIVVAGIAGLTTSVSVQGPQGLALAIQQTLTTVMAFGVPTISIATSTTVSASTLTTTLTMGSPSLAVLFGPTGVSTSMTFGSPAGNLVALAGSITTVMSFGTPTISTLAQTTVNATTLTTVLTMGSPTLAVLFGPTGVSTGVTFGSPVGTIAAVTTTLTTVLSLGSPSLAVAFLPTTLTTGTSFGSPTNRLVALIATLTTVLSFGLPTISTEEETNVSAITLTTGVTFATPTGVISGTFSMATVVSFGSPAGQLAFGASTLSTGTNFGAPTAVPIATPSTVVTSINMPAPAWQLVATLASLTTLMTFPSVIVTIGNIQYPINVTTVDGGGTGGGTTGANGNNVTDTVIAYGTSSGTIAYGVE